MRGSSKPLDPGPDPAGVQPQPASPSAEGGGPAPRFGRLSSFALRFLAWSLPLFLLWEYALRQPYLAALGRIFVLSAHLFGRQVALIDVEGANIEFAYNGVSWTDEFGMTGINVVAFMALVLATAVGWRRRLRMLAIGVALLGATQLIGLWSDIAHVHLHTHPAALPFADGLRAFLTGFGTFLFPVVIWLVLVRDRLPLQQVGRTLASGADGQRSSLL